MFLLVSLVGLALAFACTGREPTETFVPLEVPPSRGRVRWKITHYWRGYRLRSDEEIEQYEGQPLPASLLHRFHPVAAVYWGWVCPVSAAALYQHDLRYEFLWPVIRYADVGSYGGRDADLHPVKQSDGQAGRGNRSLNSYV